MVRQRFAKPLYASSNLVLASLNSLKNSSVFLRRFLRSAGKLTDESLQ